MAGFTKGPWYSVVGTNELDDFKTEWLMVSDSPNNDGKQRKMIIAVLSHADVVGDEDIPNSYLIAAAPDLYEACKALVELHLATEAIPCGKWAKCVLLCEKALLKADGKEVKE